MMLVEIANDLMTLDEFFDWYPDGYGRYELRNGEVLEMQPTGIHEQVAGFLGVKFGVQIDRFELPYTIPRQAFIKSLDTDNTCYIPDVIVLDNEALKDEPLWKKRSTITQGKTVKLIVEVVSTNWQNDYGHKLVDYEQLAIPEYWIVDYLGLGGKRYIGDPKQPTLSVYQWLDGEYQVQQFRGEEIILSQAFPELKITAQQIFAVGN
jgi:Uma2 family endonuclease